MAMTSVGEPARSEQRDEFRLAETYADQILAVLLVLAILHESPEPNTPF
jgi:hypothetical protein